MNGADEFVFVALGGLGEIGMNAALYGFGPSRRRKWIMVDCGLTFAGPDLPGVDLIFPDISFVEKIQADLLGLIITHAHEDHVGAIAALWPRLRCPLYATPFAAGLLEARRLSEPGAPDVRINIVAQGSRIELGPFGIEFVVVAHSIPESCALAIRTPAGMAVHSGDWKLDDAPGIGRPTDEARLRELGGEGVCALICDSTNIVRDGISPSEGEVAATLRTLIASAPARVLVTAFASNVARIRAVAEAAQTAGRELVVAGRSMARTSEVARECGYLDGVPDFFELERFPMLARDRIVVLATGSQGEPRAAMSRIAEGEHPVIALAPGDRVIFSSRTIPGNEREVNAVINGLILQGVDVITDRTHLVHCSGHPRRGEVERLYGWLRPAAAIPAHGEPLHLFEHARVARALGVPHVVPARNGDMVLLVPGTPCIIDEIATGRVGQDGNVLVPLSDKLFQERRRLALAGIVSVAVALSARGEVVGDPDVMICGLPPRLGNGAATDKIIDEAIFATLDSLPRQRRSDLDAVSTAIERAIRSSLHGAWGKRPQVHVLLVPV
ncbi:MAG: ribonuclease J [Beijerinckiaceae bacterium]